MVSQGLTSINGQTLNAYMAPKVDVSTKTTRSSDSNPSSNSAYDVEISAEAKKIKIQHDYDQKTVKSEYTQKKQSYDTEYKKKQQKALTEYKMAQQEIEAEYNRNNLMLQKKL